jgi:hypothetical protein
MATPIYRGAVQPQPISGSGLLGRLGSYFGGGGTPAYRGVGQPTPVISGGLLRPATPPYVAAPVKEQFAEDNEAAQAAAESEASACPIDPEALASGHIAIVIPRGT